MKTKIIAEDGKLMIKLTTETKLEETLLEAVNIPAATLKINLIKKADTMAYLIIDVDENKAPEQLKLK